MISLSEKQKHSTSSTSPPPFVLLLIFLLLLLLLLRCFLFSFSSSSFLLVGFFFFCPAGLHVVSRLSERTGGSRGSRPWWLPPGPPSSHTCATTSRAWRPNSSILCTPMLTTPMLTTPMLTGMPETKASSSTEAMDMYLLAHKVRPLILWHSVSKLLQCLFDDR